jgi:hypothetical protein
MFNSPILDVTIGLVFIFLLYSLLATSVNEAIATSLGLRARMLRTAIAERMLADTAKDKRWGSIFQGILQLYWEIVKIFTGYTRKKEGLMKIGDQFYEHPLIRNYGSSRVFPIPSYIATQNFSTVIIDVLKDEFDKRINEIAEFKFARSGINEPLDAIKQNLTYTSNIVKIKELLEFYGYHYIHLKKPPERSVIDQDTWHILDMHLRESIYDIDKFIRKVEGWFDDTMDRVSGWYKRQTQLVLLLIGLTIAIVFNVDTIEISKKLSIDRDASEKLVQMAIQATDTYKDDPRVKRTPDTSEVSPSTPADSAENYRIYREYQDKLKAIVKFTRDTLQEVNNIVALGWDEDGKKAASEHKGRKFLGWLITAFAISLGAPFWFDLLNKIIKVRGTGKKEDSGSGAGSASGSAQAPVTIHLTNQPGGEAVG